MNWDRKLEKKLTCCQRVLEWDRDENSCDKKQNRSWIMDEREDSKLILEYYT